MLPRYTTKEMEGIWNDEARFRNWAKVEAAVLKAKINLGSLKVSLPENLVEKFEIDPREIDRIEKEVTKHDVIAFLMHTSPQLSEELRPFWHAGMTSYDTQDTALSLQLAASVIQLARRVEKIKKVLREKAFEYKYTPQIGRTHGVHAEPITFGVKLANWYNEFTRHEKRLAKLLEQVSVGKISGAVGMYTLDPRVEEETCKILGLKPVLATQIISRDIIAEYMSTLAIIAGTIEKIGITVRGLQRTEILEVQEYFDREKQRGSSAMPHKRNPIAHENISGMANVMRGYSNMALGTISSWDERDLSNSGQERIYLPDSSILLDYMLKRLTGLIEKWIIHPENMERNLNLTKGLIFSQNVQTLLAKKSSLPREDAYKIVRDIAQECWESREDFKEALEKNSAVKRYLSLEDLENCFDLKTKLKYVDYIFEKVFGAENNNNLYKNMEEAKKGRLIAEGKTKKIWENENDPKTVIVEYKDDITAFNDPKFTKQFKTKGRNSNLTTCHVFELLNKAGIPTHFIKQLSETEFLAKSCRMIMIEAVPRRYAFGSYLKRNPQLEVAQGEPPVYFRRLVNEYFLKTTKGGVIIDGETLVEGLTTEQDDPLILDPTAKEWKLIFPKKPLWNPEADLQKNISAEKVLLGDTARLQQMDEILRKVFLVLEGAFTQRNYRLIDMKIEYGITNEGELVVADVIDNDSWRLRDPEWKEFSKQAFRDGEEIDLIESKYQIVADLVRDFPDIPKQALVLWTGSEKDEIPEVPDCPGVMVVKNIISGHKKTSLCLEELKKLERQFPTGGAIVAKVGMSNGLGPILATHTHWPTISIPASAKSFPDDVWSALRMPSDVPMSVIERDANAIDFALNILAKKNPILYMNRRFKLEQHDINTF